MRIPTRFAPVLFSALLSAVMVAIVSGYVLFTTQGVHPGLLAQWGRSCLRTWPIAFPTVFIVAPLVRRVVARLTMPATVAALALLLLAPAAATAQGAFVNAGGEFDLGRVQLRLEVRDYVSGFTSLQGERTRATRNDVVIMAGLRLGARR